MITPAFVVVAANVDDLHDTDLDVLIDLHLFGFDEWCREHCIITPDGALAGCISCGYVEELRQAGPHFDINAPHPRHVPRYTADMSMAWKIVTKIRADSVSTKVLFEVRLARLCASRISTLTPRMIAVAALQAIGVVDYDGFIAQASNEARS
ncbi:hypothetical protein KSF_095660 [Reticulibacter mediterranei]|uniref:Uncharacterized protein n=1 Tax=Reticulibacter mediterranei TaxID=2778369 RepID=A0A8J3N8B5_9CHLR|nr:hypothetical protein [Reticulibacter mediterranei]GHO99518.1 hypothetical protein KSF_095660 [Reticulibacter mediterranei]